MLKISSVTLTASVGDLLRRAENMRIVLREGAHPHEPVQRARGLIAMHLAELGEAQRQLAVAAQALLEHLDVTRAVHRLDREDALIRRLGHEHVLAESLDVPGLDPQLAVHDLRRVDLVVARRRSGARACRRSAAGTAPSPWDARTPRPAPLPASGTGPVPCRCADDRASPPPPAGQIFLELLLVGPGRAVDPLQHLVARIAAPVGAGHLHQLEGLELAGARHMRSAAQILPIALPVQADRLAGRNGAR